jgi:hypothetical protein
MTPMCSLNVFTDFVCMELFGSFSVDYSVMHLPIKVLEKPGNRM